MTQTKITRLETDKEFNNLRMLARQLYEALTQLEHYNDENQRLDRNISDAQETITKTKEQMQTILSSIGTDTDIPELLAATAHAEMKLAQQPKDETTTD